MNDLTEPKDIMFALINTYQLGLCFKDDWAFNDVHVLLRDSFDAFDRLGEAEEKVMRSRFRHWIWEMKCNYSHDENFNNLPYQEYIGSRKSSIVEELRQDAIKEAKKSGIYEKTARYYEP